MVKFENLCAGYEGIEILHNINLELSPGKVTVILGPNGCGKSTLLKTLVRINPHTSGDIIVAHKHISEYNSADLAKEISYLPQSRQTPEISVLRMVLHGRFPYLTYPRKYREEDFEKSMEALRWVGIEDLADENVSKLSGGTQQKVYIAMALAQDTPVILMDEPTTYLDISHQLKLMQLAKALAQNGKTVVLVLHDLALALRTADQVILLSDGTVVQNGTPDELFESGALNQTFDIQLSRVRTETGWHYYYE